MVRTEARLKWFETCLDGKEHEIYSERNTSKKLGSEEKMRGKAGS